MAERTARLLHALYEGGPADKLAQAHALHATLAARLAAAPRFARELALLRAHLDALDAQMRAMELGRLCSRCAARPGGGCCGAIMADNTDAVQILINLLLGVPVTLQPDSGPNCCFLGALGCLFAAKPIFCLNYNCTHILQSASAEHLERLYRHAAAALGQQTGIERLLLDLLREGATRCPP